MENPKDVPYIAFEGAQARMERVNNRLFKVIIALIIALFLSNALWLYAWTRYDYSDTEALDTITVDAGNGTANYIGNDGDITNGTDNGNEKTQNPDTDTKEQ